MAAPAPRVIVIAGPNGAGKSTAAPALLRDLFGIREFVNADAIARGLSEFDPDAAAVNAGRVMLRRLRELAATRADFAFETTLASRSFAPWLAELRKSGYATGLVYLWLPDPRIALARVRARASQGGHDVPEPVVRRRYERGLRNLVELYLPLADRWFVFDTTSADAVRAVARGGRGLNTEIDDDETWQAIRAPHEERRR